MIWKITWLLPKRLCLSSSIRLMLIRQLLPTMIRLGLYYLNRLKDPRNNLRNISSGGVPLLRTRRRKSRKGKLLGPTILTLFNCTRLIELLLLPSPKAKIQLKSIPCLGTRTRPQWRLRSVCLTSTPRKSVITT